MKTIMTTLPIYNKVAKQCFERARNAGMDKPVSVICPRHRLPSFQWLDGTDGASSITKIELIDSSYDGAEASVGTTWLSHTGFDVFTHTNLEIAAAENAAGVCSASTDTFSVTTKRGSQFRFIGTLVRNSGAGTEPKILIVSGDDETLAVGANNLIVVNTSASTSSLLMLYRNGATDYSLSGVAITHITGALDITSFFDAMPTLGHDYFYYNGETLKYPLPEGDYYLRITTDNGYVYYSDWFNVTCVYKNLISLFNNNGYDVLTTSGVVISRAFDSVGNISCYSDSFSMIKGESVTCIFNLVNNAGELPGIILYSASQGAIDNDSVTDGFNEIVLTSTANLDDLTLMFSNGAPANWAINDDIFLIRDYSTKYLTINFTNSCDLGDILYQDDFEQTLWIESETMEPSFPQEEEGQKNSEAKFFRSFARQIKKYTARTKAIPDFLVDVFHRMKLHDDIEIIDLVGDVNNVYNLEVEHEWLFDDRYYAKAELVFDYDEVVIVRGCCVNIPDE